jgi:hypothetical protein
MRSLRANQQKLIDQILKREETLLKSDIPDYFRDIKASSQPMEEPSGESSYKTETEEVDSFDEDFDESEDESRRDEAEGGKSETSGPRTLKRPKSKIITTFKNKKDKYFKKGFDIKQLNFEILVAEQPVKNEKPKKKRKEASDPSKMRHNYLHEAYPQTVLLKNALTVERQNMHAEDGTANYAEQTNAELTANLLASKSNCIDYLMRTVLDSETHNPKSSIYFPNEDKFQEYFSGILLQNDPSENPDKQLLAKRPGKFTTVEEYKVHAEALKLEGEKRLHQDFYFCQGLLNALEEKRSKIKTN